VPMDDMEKNERRRMRVSNTTHFSSSDSIKSMSSEHYICEDHTSDNEILPKTLSSAGATPSPSRTG